MRGVMATGTANFFSFLTSAGNFREEAFRNDVDLLNAAYYDRGYLTVDADYRLHVSSRLRSDFGNGEIYYPLEGRSIRLPKIEEQRPDRDLLSWHADRVFRT